MYLEIYQLKYEPRDIQLKYIPRDIQLKYIPRDIPVQTGLLSISTLSLIFQVIHKTLDLFLQFI